MSLPYEGWQYYIDSESIYHFNALVPYSSYSYSVEVLYPVLPYVTSQENVPNVTLADIKEWVGSINGLVDDENSELYILVKLLKDIAREIIVYDMCGSDKMYKRVVAYYVAHHLELHVKALKDEQNKMTMSAERKNEIEDAEIVRLTMVDGHFGTYKQTIWGQAFWAAYGHASKFNVGYGVY